MSTGSVAEAGDAPGRLDKEGVGFRVCEAPLRDVGRGIVRLDPKDMDRLGVAVGDIVLISGKQVTAARAMPAPADGRERGAVQMDGIVRQNAGVSIGQQALLRGGAAGTAKAVVLIPDRPAGSASPLDRRYLAKLLQGLPITAKDTVRVESRGRPRT